MKRFFAILSLVLILVGICIAEELTLKSFENNLNSKAGNLSQQIIKNEKIDSSEIEKEFLDLKSYWNDYKSKLCYFTNYEKVKALDESFIKLENAIKTDDKSLAIENVSIIKDYSQFLHYTMGFNLNNLF